MDGTDSQANLSPCVRLFIDLLFKEVGEVKSSECANSVSCRASRHEGRSLDRSGIMLAGCGASDVLLVRHSVSRWNCINPAQSFDMPGPVLIEVHVNYRENVKLFEDVHEGSIL